jgi:hypothetical protein
LEALRNLHKTNPALFNELSNDSGQPASVFDADDEAPFPETPDDASDIPLEVIQQHLALGPQGANTGYVIDEDGFLESSRARLPQRMPIQRLKTSSWRRLKHL